MLRALYILGCGYVAVCASLLAAQRFAPAEDPPAHPVAHTGPSDATGGSWFGRVRTACNALEVESVHRRFPPPTTVDGLGYSAACYALAGKIDSARAAIERLEATERSAAAGIVFAIGHPVADGGDDASAGPIMRLVAEFDPANYMALYHAGVSEYMLGHHAYAREHLQRFVAVYDQQDGWRSNALTLLERMGGE